MAAARSSGDWGATSKPASPSSSRLPPTSVAMIGKAQHIFQKRVRHPLFMRRQGLPCRWHSGFGVCQDETQKIEGDAHTCLSGLFFQFGLNSTIIADKQHPRWPQFNFVRAIAYKFQRRNDIAVSLVRDQVGNTSDDKITFRHVQVWQPGSVRSSTNKLTGVDTIIA